jgi:hypothetical protein
MRRRPRLKIGPGLTVEANREMKFLETRPFFKFSERMGFTQVNDLSSSNSIKIVGKHIEELKGRGYPEAWIERDIQNLVEGL